MLIYNVTTKVDWSIADEWLQWMQETHIPGIMQTGCLVKFRFARLLEVDEDEGPTYAVQFFAPTQTQYDQYINNHAPGLREETNNKWGNKYISFRSLMEIVDE